LRAEKKKILAEYDDALKESVSDPYLSEILTRQRAALVAKITDMKRISA
jgi:hypothetical protein